MKDNVKNSEQEIDLVMLLKGSFRVVYSLLSKLVIFVLKIVSYLILFGIKKWTWLAVVFIIGISYGGASYYFSEKSIVTDMVIRNNEVPNDELITILNELSVYANQNNKLALSRKMNLDTTITKKIKSIDAYWFIDEDMDGIADYVDFKRDFNQLEDTTLRRINKVLNIRVGVDNSNIISELEGGVLYYLNSNAILKRLNTSRKNRLEALIAKTQLEIVELDRLQNYEYFEKEQKADIDLGSLGKLRLQGEEKDTRLLHTQILDLEQSRLDYEMQMNVYSEVVSVLSGFALSEKPEKSLAWVALKNGIGFGVICYFILFILGHRVKFVKLIEEFAK